MIENESMTDIATHEVVEDAAVVEAPSSAPRASLTLKRAGAETDQVFEFGSPATVGRFDPAVGPIDVDLGSIDESVYVSRKHAKLVFEDGVWKVQDLGSSNGTFVLRSDFEKVETAELADGDELAFGNARFVFRSGGAAEEAPAEAEAEADIADSDTGE